MHQSCMLPDRAVWYPSRALWRCSPRSKVADEESLQWKTLNMLTYAAGLRIYADSDPLHPLWNNVKLAIRKSGLGPALLKATLMSHTDHAPFDSGVNLVTKKEAAEHWCQAASQRSFQELQENMAFDRGCSATHDGLIPQDVWDVLGESAVTSLGIYASVLALLFVHVKLPV